MSPEVNTTPDRFIRENTELMTNPLVPEIKLWLASEIVPIWQMTEEDLAAENLPPPYWAFAWAGGQAISRYVLDHPESVRGKRVLDFACGSAIQGIAAALSGASEVEAADIDPFARAAAALNAEANGVSLKTVSEDLTETNEKNWDVILAGDICYEAPLAKKVETWLRQRLSDGAEVIMGDPGRSYFPRHGLERIIAYSVKTTRELEDSDLRNAVVWRMIPL
ncbi:MAG: 50S ribosomal protein L11 methyltransferase [Kiloniellales bacterium]|nr:50S ribosomal protein L11 methyltransferase [Kiloniellales bacterium]